MKKRNINYAFIAYSEAQRNNIIATMARVGIKIDEADILLIKRNTATGLDVMFDAGYFIGMADAIDYIANKFEESKGE